MWLIVMYSWLLVGAGGFLGAVFRWQVGSWLQNAVVDFPFGTLGVNVAGSFMLGLFLYLAEYGGFFGADAKLFFAVGFVGAFTTMSSFGFESLKLLERNEFVLFAANVLGTVSLVLLAVFLGEVFAARLAGLFS